jgi:hypothetical protein
MAKSSRISCNRFCGGAPFADQVGESNAMVGVAHEMKTLPGACEGFKLTNAVEMADSVLRERARPAAHQRFHQWLVRKRTEHGRELLPGEQG